MGRYMFKAINKDTRPSSMNIVFLHLWQSLNKYSLLGKAFLTLIDDEDARKSVYSYQIFQLLDEN